MAFLHDLFKIIDGLGSAAAVYGALTTPPPPRPTAAEYTRYYESFLQEKQAAAPPPPKRKIEPPNPYKMLGVLDDAPDDVVRAAYKAAAKRVHSDHGGSDQEMARLNNAIEEIGRRRRWTKPTST